MRKRRAVGVVVEGIGKRVQTADVGCACQLAPLLQGMAHGGFGGSAPQGLQLLLEGVNGRQGLVGLHECLQALGAGGVQFLAVAEQQVQRAFEHVLALCIGLAEFRIADVADQVAKDLRRAAVPSLPQATAEEPQLEIGLSLERLKAF